MFPTTVWTTIREAGDADPTALEEFARSYREPVLETIRRRGFRGEDAEDLCQEVFLRVLQGGVLAKADPERGRFRSLLVTVTRNSIHDRLRRRRPETELPEEPGGVADSGDGDADFDRDWVWHLTTRALERLRESGSPYHGVLERHLAGEPQDRNKLWIARGKLAGLVRGEIAATCASTEDYERELAHLAPYMGLADRKKA